MSSNSIILAQAQLAADLKTVLLMHFQNTYADDTGKTVTVSGSPIFSGGATAGTQCLRLIGSENLSVGPHSDFIFGNDDFTMECFLYNTQQTSSGVENLISLSNGTAGIGMGYYPGNNLVYLASGTTVLATAALGSATNWPHVAYSRKGNVGRLFIRGVKVAEVADNSPINSGMCTVGKASVGGPYNWYGYLDEVRVSKGARYWDNFAAPVAPLSL